MEIWKSPKFLIIHLKRFAYYNNRWIKSSRLVNFPLTELDLSSWLVSQDKNIQYDLYGCINHYGRLGGGHYTAYGVHPGNGNWYCFDDNSVVPMEGDNMKDIVSPAAYLLFYKQRGIRVEFGQNNLIHQTVTKSPSTDDPAQTPTPPPTESENQNNDNTCVIN